MVSDVFDSRYPALTLIKSNCRLSMRSKRVQLQRYPIAFDLKTLFRSRPDIVQVYQHRLMYWQAW